MNKSLATNLISLALIGLAYLTPIYHDQLLAIGLFAASGAFTNWLAIHMLFEKVPGLYGSGVIPAQFEEFKTGIRNLIMNQFFTPEKVSAFFAEETEGENRILNPDTVVDAIDYDHVYSSFIDVVLSSSFGGMLALVGGAKALAPLRDPFIRKMREEVLNILTSPTFNKALRNSLKSSHLAEDIVQKADLIVTRRLDELTPEMVKKIVQDMIRKHLGWLVVWGGVFGGILGLIASFFR
ncbi:MAG: DUF445 domain-containing protein [bacterium]|nr:DUF445 domain-containing protein [bacterium]